MPFSTDTRRFAVALRQHALEMTSAGGSAHIGSVFSCADLLAVLYGGWLRVRPEEPRWAARDRFILSKGHAGAGVYAALALRGFFPLAWLETHGQDGALLSGHVSHRGIPGVEFSTGSLGHGLSVAAGMALAATREDATREDASHRVVALLSDGECDAGATWEAALFAAHHGLDRLIAIVDYNGVQSLGRVQDTMRLEPFASKWESFGWRVHDCDGHDHDAVRAALDAADAHRGSPSVVLARTVKGKGVSFMEAPSQQVLWHYRTARGAELEAARRELAAAALALDPSGALVP